jgi:dipeptidyl aminopeptidase/acylaminoacyl peptidase
MMRLRFVSVLMIGCSMTAAVCGADKESAADREQVFRRYLGIAGLVKGGSVTAHWLADGNRFWYAADSADGPVIYLVDPEKNSKQPLLDADRLRKAFKEIAGVTLPGKGLPFRTVEFVDGDERLRLEYARKSWLLTLRNYQLAEDAPEREIEKPRLIRSGTIVGEAATMEVPAPDGRWFATERDHNLGLRTPGKSSVTMLTADGQVDQAWSVGKQMWSPDGKKLAAFKTDMRQVPRYPIVHWLQPGLEVTKIPMTRPGGAVPQQELFVIDVASHKATRVDTGSGKDQHLGVVRWLPDGSALLFARVDRAFKKLELCAADPATGNTRVIVTETQKTFVQVPLLGDYSLPLLANGKGLLWLSERSGWNHIDRYDMDGQLVGQLTRGEFPVVRIVEVDEPGGWVYFTAHGDKDRPYDTHFYRVSLTGEGMTKLTEAEGQHDTPAYLGALGVGSSAGVQLSPSKRFFLDTHSSIDRPPATELRRADGKLLQVLGKANIDELKKLNWKPPESFIVKAADGKTDIYGVLYKPSDFDPAKKYPVLDNIYNGPQTTWVPRTFNGTTGMLPQALAQLGYIVMVVDGRGTPERSKAFQDVAYGDFGGHEVPDHVAALRQLTADRPYMDQARVGIFGGSFGGYMTVRAMLTAPDVYKVGVATAPIYELNDVPAFMELYMDTPAANPKGYEAASCLRLASKLKGKLLIIHGTSDVNAPFAATIKMLSAFVAAGKYVDLIVLPEETHALRGNPLYWIDATRRYFSEHLRPQ